MTTEHPRLGSVSVKQLLSSLPSAQGSGVGNAFSFERMLGQVIQQIHHACDNTSFPVSAVTLITYVACDDLESESEIKDFNELHLAFTSDLSIKLKDIENRIILVDKNGVAGVMSKHQFIGLSEHAKILKKMSLLDQPTVVFQLNESKMSLFNKGIKAGALDHQAFGTINSLLDGKNLDSALDHFDSQWINSPKGYSGLWKEASKYVPCKAAESVIQRWMNLSLMSADRGSVVIDEINNPSGRADLWVKPKIAGNGNSAIIELKVLRSFSCPKEEGGSLSPVADTINVESAKEVVRQGAAYRDEVGASRGLACIYDMRKPPAEPTAIDEAIKLAAIHSVFPRSITVFNSAHAKRIENYSATDDGNAKP